MLILITEKASLERGLVLIYHTFLSLIQENGLNEEIRPQKALLKFIIGRTIDESNADELLRCCVQDPNFFASLAPEAPPAFDCRRNTI